MTVVAGLLATALACGGVGPTWEGPTVVKEVRVSDLGGAQKTLRIAPDWKSAGSLHVVEGGMQLHLGQRARQPAVDNAVGPVFAEVSGWGLGSNDYWAVGGRTDAGWMVVTRDGPGPAFERVGPPVVGSKGRTAYVVADGKAQRLVLDGSPVPDAFDEVRILDFTRLGDLRVAWVGRRGEFWFTAVDTKIGETAWQRVGAGVLGLYGDAAWAVRDAQGWHMVRGGERFGPFEDLGPPTFSPDGRHLGWGASRDGAWHAFIDGASRGVYDRIGGPGIGWTPDGRPLWWAKSGEELRVWADGVAIGPSFPEFSDTTVAGVGDTVAWIARPPDGDRSWAVVLNGEVLSRHLEVFPLSSGGRRELALSDDGRWVAWGAPSRDWGWVDLYVADTRTRVVRSLERVGAGFATDVGGGLRITNNGLSFTVVRPDGLYLVEAVIR